MNEPEFDGRIERLDLTLFSRIQSQTSESDRKSLLAIQACTRECVEEYVCLEIGSHLGGSIQPHLLDPKCKKIYSIDKRPLSQPDERGSVYEYPQNSTERMLSLLTAISLEKVKKIESIDGDVKFISPSRISTAPNLCFIDGEHTRAAVVTDFEFCLRVSAAGATFVFHDAQIVFRGLRSVVSRLWTAGRRFSGHALSDAVYAFCLDQSPIPARLAKFSSQAREDDLWSPRSDLRLLKWRALALKERASGFYNEITR